MQTKKTAACRRTAESGCECSLDLNRFHQSTWKHTVSWLAVGLFLIKDVPHLDVHRNFSQRPTFSTTGTAINFNDLKVSLTPKSACFHYKVPHVFIAKYYTSIVKKYLNTIVHKWSIPTRYSARTSQHNMKMRAFANRTGHSKNIYHTCWTYNLSINCFRSTQNAGKPDQ